MPPGSLPRPLYPCYDFSMRFVHCLRFWMQAAPLPSAMAVMLACVPLALLWSLNPLLALGMALGTGVAGFFAGCFIGMAMDSLRAR